MGQTMSMKRWKVKQVSHLPTAPLECVFFTTVPDGPDKQPQTEGTAWVTATTKGWDSADQIWGGS